MVAPIAMKCDVDRVFLVGSYARGEADGDSDIDFVIDKGRLRGLQLAGMLSDLQERFGRDVDLLTIPGIEKEVVNSNLKQSIEKDMGVVYEQQRA